jgi:hypothetical protein
MENETSVENNIQKKEKNLWKTNHILRSHLDGVRSLYFTAQDNLLVSAAEVYFYVNSGWTSQTLGLL